MIFATALYRSNLVFQSLSLSLFCLPYIIVLRLGFTSSLLLSFSLFLALFAKWENRKIEKQIEYFLGGI